MIFRRFHRLIIDTRAKCRHLKKFTPELAPCQLNSASTVVFSENNRQFTFCEPKSCQAVQEQSHCRYIAVALCVLIQPHSYRFIDYFPPIFLIAEGTNSPPPHPPSCFLLYVDYFVLLVPSPFSFYNLEFFVLPLCYCFSPNFPFLYCYSQPKKCRPLFPGAWLQFRTVLAFL